MKKTLKVLIPLVLVIAIIAAACWFFFFYRVDLTTGFLLTQAETMSGVGRYDRAILYYRWAWKLAPERDDIPIQLAETYVSADNYTKAEYTLVKAISNHPDLTELYVALCRTYVAQNKFLDAVQMLDRTTDSDVKNQLNAMRPAAPVVLPESGYYNEYIEVTADADTNAVYMTTDGDYPSSESDRYNSPVTLTSGETAVLAVCVNKEGLVSPVTMNGYTVGGVVEEVILQDSAIDNAIREQIGLDPDDELMSDLLWSITHLVIPETVETLDDLSRFSGLRSLTIQNVSGLDFAVLNQVPSLQELDLSGCTLSSNALEAIGTLPELQKLTLNGCALTDITAFAQLTELTELNLANNTLEDIGVISLMPQLTILSLSNNPLSSIAALSNCKKLSYLDITDCAVSSLGSLSGNTNLETLLAPNNFIKNLDDLSDCSSLRVLEVSNNYISDIFVLSMLPNLTHFDADHNQIAEIPNFDESNCKLIQFSINYNEVEDVSGLSGIDSLNYVNLDYNKVKDLLPLAENTGLVQINAWDNPISEESVEGLAEFSIILNHNPNYVDPDAEENTEE